MSLDDRLRGAHQRQLDDVKQRVRQDSDVVVPMRASVPSVGARALIVAAALVLVVGGSVFVSQLLTGSEGTLLQTDNGSDGGEIPPATSTPDRPPTTGTTTSEDTSDESVTTATPSAPVSTQLGQPTIAAPVPPPGVPSTGSASTTVPQTTLPATTARPATAASESTVPSSALPTIGAGLPNQVCPSGHRAEMEAATLRYVGPNEGWGRLDDLVDEQEGPFYFMAWEPGYPDEVTVEIVFAQPVLANEIRVAQDPFTPVSGVIDFGFEDGSSLSVALSGTDGWKFVGFPSMELSSFTITRSVPEANIMEVLVCVDP